MASISNPESTDSVKIEDLLVGAESLQDGSDNYDDGEDMEDDNYDMDDDDYLKKLVDLEMKNMDSKCFKGLDAVDFDDDDDDDEDDDYDDDEIEEGNVLPNMDKPTTNGISQALVKADQNVLEDDGEDINSDEERDILKGIRDDIDQKVREEMKDELSMYQERMKAITEGRLPGRTDDEKSSETQSSTEMDPQLLEAIAKMNKLDKILRKKVKREKEVKRERILLERRMRHEISTMEHGASHYKEIKMNTERFLALAPPPSHNEGVSVDVGDEEEDGELPPLFQTQVDDSELDWRKKQGKKAGTDGSSDSTNDREARSESSVSSTAGRSRSSKSGVNGGSRPHGKKNKKDFIKRNKELAAEADQPVAMTDDEKRRLQTLLEGVDELPEIEEGEIGDSVMDLNPFQVSVQPGEGFCPDNAESRSLTAIDQRLRGLMPDQDYRSLFSTGGREGGAAKGATPSQPLFTRVGLHSTGNDAAALERFGERVLYDTKEERELKARLQAIESQLELFKSPQEMEDDKATDYHLTDQQLDDLLDQCAHNMGFSEDLETPQSTPRSQLSSRQSMMANPPRLTDEQLQQLLSDAHFPLSSRLLALRDDDQKIEEEEGNTEMIRAETWIAIRDAEIAEESGAVIAAEGGDKSGLIDTVSQSTAFRPGITRISGPESSLDLAENKNMSTNNAYPDDGADMAAAPDARGPRAIDDFAYTPDITNPMYNGGGGASGAPSTLQSSSSPTLSQSHTAPRRNSETLKEGRGSSGGARPKHSGSGTLPRIPHPPQVSSQSSASLRASSDSDGRFNASSYASSSRDSFDSMASTLVNNSNGALGAGCDGMQTPVRLPEISSNSFLIHTPQGLNNDDRAQSRGNLPPRPPLQMVRNNLSDISLTSLSADDRDDAGPAPSPSPSAPIKGHVNNITKSTANRRSSSQLQGLEPTPPPGKK